MKFILIVLVMLSFGWLYAQGVPSPCELGNAKDCLAQGNQFADRDLLKAKSFYKKACSLDELLGCRNLGAIERKEGNLGKAKEFFLKACLGGLSEVCMGLAGWAEGEGQVAEAKKFFKKACELGLQRGCDEVAKQKSSSESTSAQEVLDLDEVAKQKSSSESTSAQEVLDLDEVAKQKSSSESTSAQEVLDLDEEGDDNKGGPESFSNAGLLDIKDESLLDIKDESLLDIKDDGLLDIEDDVIGKNGDAKNVLVVKKKSTSKLSKSSSRKKKQRSKKKVRRAKKVKRAKKNSSVVTQGSQVIGDDISLDDEACKEAHCLVLAETRVSQGKIEQAMRLFKKACYAGEKEGCERWDAMKAARDKTVGEPVQVSKVAKPSSSVARIGIWVLLGLSLLGVLIFAFKFIRGRGRDSF